jgi:hypothetical protein
MSTEFLPTESEQAFVAHFSHETSSDAPAVDWLNSHGIHWNLLDSQMKCSITVERGLSWQTV